MYITTKPVRKCGGCELNFRKYCGVYEVPRLMWDRGKCPGFNSEEMLMKYKESRAMVTRAKEEARRKRQEVQALRKTEPHHSGHENPADKGKAAATRPSYTVAKGSRKLTTSVARKGRKMGRAAVRKVG